MRLLLLSLLGLLTATLSANPYYVVSIKGEVFQGEEPLAPRDQLEETTELRFLDKNAQVYVMSPRQGYFVLGPGEEQDSDKSEFLLAVRQALLPASEWKMTGIRAITEDSSGVHLEDTFDMLGFFRGRIALIDGLQVTFSPDYFSMEEGFLELTTITAANSFTDTLPIQEAALDLAVLIQEDVELAQTAFTLSYQPEYGEDELLEAEPFQLVQVDAEQLKQELAYLYELMAAEDRPFFESQLAVEFVTSRYGKMHAEELASIIDQSLKVEEE